MKDHARRQQLPLIAGAGANDPGRAGVSLSRLPMTWQAKTEKMNSKIHLYLKKIKFK